MAARPDHAATAGAHTDPGDDSLLRSQSPYREDQSAQDFTVPSAKSPIPPEYMSSARAGDAWVRATAAKMQRMKCFMRISFWPRNAVRRLSKILGKSAGLTARNCYCFGGGDIIVVNFSPLPFMLARHDKQLTGVETDATVLSLNGTRCPQDMIPLPCSTQCTILVVISKPLYVSHRMVFRYAVAFSVFRFLPSIM